MNSKILFKLGLVAAMAAVSIGFTYHSFFSYVITINGTKIPLEEFKWVMNQNRTSIISEIQTVKENGVNKNSSGQRENVFEKMFEKTIEGLIIMKRDWEKASLLRLIIPGPSIKSDKVAVVTSCKYSFFNDYYQINYNNQRTSGLLKYKKEQAFFDFMNRIELALKLHERETENPGMPLLVRSSKDKDEVVINSFGKWFFKTFYYNNN